MTGRLRSKSVPSVQIVSRTSPPVPKSASASAIAPADEAEAPPAASNQPASAASLEIEFDLADDAAQHSPLPTDVAQRLLIRALTYSVRSSQMREAAIREEAEKMKTSAYEMRLENEKLKASVSELSAALEKRKRKADRSHAPRKLPTPRASAPKPCPPTSEDEAERTAAPLSAPPAAADRLAAGFLREEALAAAAHRQRLADPALQRAYRRADEFADAADAADAASLQSLGAYFRRVESLRERARAVFRWVATAVRYEKGATRAVSPLTPGLAEEALRTREAACGGFAALYAAVALQAGLKVRAIPGICAGSTHAWNAVAVEEGEILVDPAWAAGPAPGAAFEPYWFDVPPALLAADHFPYSEANQMLPGRARSTDYVRDRLTTTEDFVKHGFELEAGCWRWEQAGPRFCLLERAEGEEPRVDLAARVYGAGGELERGFCEAGVERAGPGLWRHTLSFALPPAARYRVRLFARRAAGSLPSVEVASFLAAGTAAPADASGPAPPFPASYAGCGAATLRRYGLEAYPPRVHVQAAGPVWELPLRARPGVALCAGVRRLPAASFAADEATELGEGEWAREGPQGGLEVGFPGPGRYHVRVAARGPGEGGYARVLAYVVDAAAGLGPRGFPAALAPGLRLAAPLAAALPAGRAVRFELRAAGREVRAALLTCDEGILRPDRSLPLRPASPGRFVGTAAVRAADAGRAMTLYVQTDADSRKWVPAFRFAVVSE